MADDGTGRNIGIPSVLISKSEGARLEEEVAKGTKIMVEMSWDIPHPDNHVEWEFWTSSGDGNAAKFLEEFRKPAIALGDAVSFTPNYGIIDGSWYACDAPGLPCDKQCTNNGRYCAEDPDHDLQHGVDGQAVIQENLRQICIFQHSNTTGKPALWWDYVAEFAESCTGQGHLTEECSTAAMKKVKVDTEAVAACVAGSGGSAFMGGVNTLLEAQIERTGKVGVATLPAIRINEKNYHGSFACPAPLSLATCPVLGAICAGFQSGAKAPAACRTDHCWADAGVDACGVCGGDGSTCMGCDGVANSGNELDLCGVCGGTGSFDKCGKCLPAGDVFRNQSCMGCDGVANSGKKLDACGVCGGDGSTDLCGNCFPKGSPMRNRACADSITLSMEVVATAAAAAAAAGGAEPSVGELLAAARTIEEGVAAMLKPNVTSADDVTVLTIAPTGQNSSGGGRATIRMEISAHPGTGIATSAWFERSVSNGGFDKEMAARKVAIRAAPDASLPAPSVREGTPAAGTQNYVPTGGGGGGERSLAAGQVAAIAAGGVVALALFGVGVRLWVVAREDRVRMDMRNLIQDMGKPMGEIQNPSSSGSSADANVDFNAL